MDSTVIASVVGFISAVVTALLASILTRRRLRLELSSLHRSELAKKQLQACEAMWSVLEPTSFSAGAGRIIVQAKDSCTVDVQAASQLSESITRVFYSSHGLYLSRDARSALFEFRDFIRDELTSGSDSKQLPISNTKAKDFRRKATKIRIALRAEIGVEDLGAARDLGADV